MHIPHIGTKRKPPTKAGNPNILVHMVAMYNASQAVLGFMCCLVLHLPDVHARIDAFAAHNGIVRGYTENLVITATIYRHMRLTSRFYDTSYKSTPVSGFVAVMTIAKLL